MESYLTTAGRPLALRPAPPLRGDLTGRMLDARTGAIRALERARGMDTIWGRLAAAGASVTRIEAVLARMEVRHG